MLEQVSLFALIPAIFAVLGGFIATVFEPRDKLTSAAQHFAGGVVFAAVAKELLPKVGAAHDTFALVIGFTLGIVTMLAVKTFTETLEEKHIGNDTLALAFIFAVAIDLIIDGLLIGVSFLAGEQGGVLITIALAIEILFLSLSTTATLSKKGATIFYRSSITFMMALLVFSGAILGIVIFSVVSLDILNIVIAFGVAALLYLVTEELLIEAHAKADTPWITALFFLGFLLILLLEQ